MLIKFLIVLNVITLSWAVFLSFAMTRLQNDLARLRNQFNELRRQFDELKEAQKELERPAVKIEQARGVKPSSFMSNPLFELDETKRKSLQPSNHHKAPLGYKAINDEDGNTVFERSYPVAFIYKFFGSALIIDGNQVVGGLSPRVHTLEVNAEGQITIDNEIKQIHPDIVEKIRIIAHTQE